MSCKKTDYNFHLLLKLKQKTGTPLRGGKRVQFNMFIRKIDDMRNYENYKTALLPIFWIDEGIELNDDMVDLLNTNLFNLVNAVYIAVWVVIGVGIALFVGLTVFYFYRRRRASQNI